LTAASGAHGRRRKGNGGRGNGYALTTPTAVSSFKGANENIRTLGTRLKRKDKDRFLNFQKSLEQHVMTEFKNPADIIVAVRDIVVPIKPLMKDMPKLSDLTDDMVLTDAERADALMIESLGKLHAEEMKVFAARRAMLRQNKTKIYGVIWGQCRPALQSELMGKQEYQAILASRDPKLIFRWRG
jgi:hypothetical protein